MKQVTVSILVLSSVLGFALSSNINIDGSCPTDGFGCMQCLSRGSGDIESCQQLYFFVNNTNVRTLLAILIDLASSISREKPDTRADWDTGF